MTQTPTISLVKCLIYSTVQITHISRFSLFHLVTEMTSFCPQDVDVLFMQSDGGLTPMEQFCGSRAVLSGPAGGVVGYAITSYSQTEKKPVIGFDMGGE